jgi:hypothetical protein
MVDRKKQQMNRVFLPVLIFIWIKNKCELFLQRMKMIKHTKQIRKHFQSGKV